jgi:hypothetical protein
MSVCASCVPPGALTPSRMQSCTCMGGGLQQAAGGGGTSILGLAPLPPRRTRALPHKSAHHQKSKRRTWAGPCDAPTPVPVCRWSPSPCSPPHFTLSPPPLPRAPLSARLWHVWRTLQGRGHGPFVGVQDHHGFPAAPGCGSGAWHCHARGQGRERAVSGGGAICAREGRVQLVVRTPPTTATATTTTTTNTTTNTAAGVARTRRVFVGAWHGARAPRQRRALSDLVERACAARHCVPAGPGGTVRPCFRMSAQRCEFVWLVGAAMRVRCAPSGTVGSRGVHRTGGPAGCSCCLVGHPPLGWFAARRVRA